MNSVYIAAIVIVLAVLLFFLSQGRKPRYPYQQHDHLFTPAEWRFYQALQQAVPEDLLLFGKVRVADVLKPEKGLDRSLWQRAFNKIAGKHFDFVLCAADTGRMCCAIELNDRSHQRRDRQDRDTFLVGACENAHFPLLMIPVARQYDTAELRSQIQRAIAGLPAPATKTLPDATARPGNSPTPDGDLACPRCGSPLVERTARRGQNPGQTFLACTAYPRCRYSAPIE